MSQGLRAKVAESLGIVDTSRCNCRLCVDTKRRRHYRARWRTGRKLGRTIYAMAGDVPDDDDELLGIMDTAVLAAMVVEDHNLRREEAAALDPEG